MPFQYALRLLWTLQVHCGRWLCRPCLLPVWAEEHPADDHVCGAGVLFSRFKGCAGQQAWIIVDVVVAMGLVVTVLLRNQAEKTIIKRQMEILLSNLVLYRKRIVLSRFVLALLLHKSNSLYHNQTKWNSILERWLWSSSCCFRSEVYCLAFLRFHSSFL